MISLSKEILRLRCSDWEGNPCRKEHQCELSSASEEHLLSSGLLCLSTLQQMKGMADWTKTLSSIENPPGYAQPAWGDLWGWVESPQAWETTLNTLKRNKRAENDGSTVRRVLQLEASRGTIEQVLNSLKNEVCNLLLVHCKTGSQHLTCATFQTVPSLEPGLNAFLSYEA